MIVVDASLAAKWFLEEADSRAALTFLDRYAGQLGGPDILLVEVASAIVRRCNMRLTTRRSALTSIQDWHDLWQRGDIATHRLTPDLISSAGAIALAIGHPISDCIYLTLAMDMDCDLATSDVKFGEKAVIVWERVKLLSDYNGTS